jgi:hypothetical protein
LSFKVSIGFMPVSLWLDHVCASFATCGPGG